ncbi:hypothetical protein H4Q26_000825 [Puccinia striiformis f. sp. tritici PST-130]|nr:hypothetical protein H4Q26_000825 [Puccinia striiformis f. sp. tritici PST-130]
MDAPLMMIWIATISIISFSFSTASPLNRRSLGSLRRRLTFLLCFATRVRRASQITNDSCCRLCPPQTAAQKTTDSLEIIKAQAIEEKFGCCIEIENLTTIERSRKNIEPPSQAEAPHNQESLGSFERLKDIPKNQNCKLPFQKDSTNCVSAIKFTDLRLGCRALGQFFKRIKSKFVNLFELLLMNIKRTFRNSHAPSQSEAQSAGEVQTNAAYTEPEGAVQELLAPSKPETSGKEVPAFHQTTTSDVSSPTPPGWRLATLPSYVFNYFCDQAKSHMPGHLIPSFLQNPEPEKVSESCRKLVSKVPSPKPVEKSLLPNNDLKVQKELERFIHATIQPLIQEIVTPEDTRELLAAIRTESNPIYRWVMNMIPDATAHNLMMNILMPDAVKGASRWSAEKIMSTVSDFAAKRKAIHN